MLALRGDIPLGETTTCGDFNYATDLVKFVRDEFGDKFEIAVAGSPEGHIACRSLDADIAVLRQKQEQWCRLYHDCQLAGIWSSLNTGWIQSVRLVLQCL